MEVFFGKYFFSLFLFLLFGIRLGTQHSARDKELRYFWLTLISCFLLILEDYAETVASLYPEMRFWRTLMSVAGYFLRSTATLGLALVVIEPEKRTWRLWVPCLLNLAVCSTAFFTDIAFGFNQDYAFYRGPLGYVAFVVPLGYLILILWVTFRRYAEKGRRQDRMILGICTFMALLSAGLDVAIGGVRLHEAILISSVFFYVFLRSYDVRRDSLTGLLNRRSLFDDCVSLKDRISGAASLDLDGLKLINDREGYRAADEVLKRIGECLQEESGSQVRPYRIGGDDFVLLFLGQEEDSVRSILNRISDRIGELGYSVSCGYAMAGGNEGPESLIHRADISMFERKARHYREQQLSRRWQQGSGTADEAVLSLGQTIEDSPEPAAIFRYADHRVEILAVSDGFCRLFGFPNQTQAVHILDEDMYREVLTEDQERFSGAVLRFAEGQEDLDIVYRTRSGIDAGYRVIHARGVHLHTGSAERIGYLWYMDEGVYLRGEEESGTQLNRTLNRALHDESVLHAAQYDHLTGLPNLGWYFTLYETEKDRIQKEGGQTALLYMDLKGLEGFNRRNGLADGDQFLKTFADILKGIFGKQRCCHMVAGRFAAVASEEEADAKIARLFEETARMNGGRTLPVHVGIYPESMEDVPFSTAYDRAKMACDAISENSASVSHPYSRKLLEDSRKHQYVVDNIDRALEENWIQVYYQPIVRTVSGEICDEEALARWQDPVQGFLSPDDFIPYLENAGLIHRMDLYVVDRVLDKILEEKEAGGSPVSHSVNLSRADFVSCDIVEEIRKRVDAAEIPRDRITIEITESMIANDMDFIKKQVDRFRALGFPVWMDDFGSGYSTLDVLQSIHFDLIKFDMSFMKKFDEGDSSKIILNELMRMASALGVDTVCEGVETEAQVRFLKEAGCSKLQGYLFGRPVPREKIPQRAQEGFPAVFEAAEASAYYETVGRLNLYDLDVLASSEGSSFQYSFNTLPMAIVEIRDGEARYVRNTPSYREFVRRFFGEERAALRTEFMKYTTPFMSHIIQACREPGSRTFFHEKVPDGTVIHSFARQVGVNPVNGNHAVAIAVLSISEAAGAEGTEETES